MARRALVSPSEGTTPSTGGGLQYTNTNAGKATTWTAAFWQKVGPDGTNQTVFASTTGSEQIWRDTTGLMRARVDTSSGSANSTTSVEDSVWHHVCVQMGINFDSGIDAKTYIDGTLEGSLTAAVAALELDDDNITYYLLQDDGADSDFPGRVYDFILIEGIHPPGDLNYDSSAGGRWKDIEGSVSFGANGFRIDGQNSGNAGADSSGNGHDFAQSAGGGSVTLEDGDVPPGAENMSDEFNATTLAPKWTFEAGASGTAETSMTGTAVSITGSGDIFNAENAPARIVQEFFDGDFTVSWKIGSRPTTAYKMIGVLLAADASNHIQFRCYGNAGSTYGYFAETIAGDTTAHFNGNISSRNPTEFRFVKSGSSYSFQNKDASSGTWNAPAAVATTVTPVTLALFVGDAQDVDYTNTFDFIRVEASEGSTTETTSDNAVSSVQVAASDSGASLTISLQGKNDGQPVASADISYAIRNAGTALAAAADISGATTTDANGDFVVSDESLTGPVAITVVVTSGAYDGQTLHAASVALD